ncbi:phosphoenolpyruvate synthase [Thiorhodospira sibirica]|uniref:phosphoenolpyruvate synthase n=1 Tax=Thiorhodospira sibirica TaxID=154347 RepID=UPI00022C04BC|nr:phosphoenolpyruvate synthase [Thiorhodospira sibirica]
MENQHIIWFEQLNMHDVPRVGGKNASLGEMISGLANAGVRVPGGFATTADAFREFLSHEGLGERINTLLNQLDVNDITALREAGSTIRRWMVETPFPPALQTAITEAYAQLTAASGGEVAVAVRSSATAEDLPDASFAGQQETFLNVRGLPAVLKAVHEVFASLYNDRAISYRVHQGFAHADVALSAGIQRMVRSDIGASGVMFTLDTESGFRDVVFITASWGLGETVVQGAVNPDEFHLYKPALATGQPAILRRHLGSKAIKMIFGEDGQNTRTVEVADAERRQFCITEAQLQELAQQAVIIEKHYGRPMDVEWALDGVDGKIYIVQARPETVESRADAQVIERYRLRAPRTEVLASGRAIGQKIGAGTVRVVANLEDMDKVAAGDVLVTDMTDPDWEPVMKRAAAIVTNRGGRTCFAGDTQLLTNRGFISFAQLHEQGCEGISVPALNRETLRVEWKPVEAVMQKTAPTLTVEVSQTGRMQGNTLTLTPDHKMLNLRNAALVDTEMQDMLAADEAVLLAQYLPPLSSSTEKERSLAYLLGGLMSDGHIHLSATHGEVNFVQKPTALKAAFIERMNAALELNDGKTFKVSAKKPSSGMIRGMQVVGEANAYRCYSKGIAEALHAEQESIITTLLKSDAELAAHFLAGLIDGDGTFAKGRVNLYIGTEETLQAAIVACMRLGTVPQVTRNRTIYNLQLVEKLDHIGRYTQRVHCRDTRRVGTRFFNARQLFAGAVGSDVNHRMRKNYLITARGLHKALATVQDPAQQQRVQTLLDSDIRQSRVRLQTHNPAEPVYNITVADHHNYIVFTERYSPVLVNNCHAAIIARELGIPAVVGCGDATKTLADGQAVTVTCAEGDEGRVYRGQLDFEVMRTRTDEMPEIGLKVMMNVGNPGRAFHFRNIPNHGVGLARLEFIINTMIGIHPKALLEYDRLPAELQKDIAQRTAGYADPVSFYVEKLVEGIATLGASFHPNPVIVRLSDFKSNEYANLFAGERYEPHEENPMIGFRGTSRYLSSDFRACFELECRALKRVRDGMGLTNIQVMVPFVRTLDEARAVIELLAEMGLKRGENGLKILMMCEIPSNAVLADEFLEYFDGFSIGSNDMTQLTLGLDRDSGLIAHLFDERDPAVKKMLKMAIDAARRANKYVGICGQGPSDYPDLAIWLMEQGIESISLNPDTVLETWLKLSGNTPSS